MSSLHSLLIRRASIILPNGQLMVGDVLTCDRRRRGFAHRQIVEIAQQLITRNTDYRNRRTRVNFVAGSHRSPGTFPGTRTRTQGRFVYTIGTLAQINPPLRSPHDYRW